MSAHFLIVFRFVLLVIAAAAGGRKAIDRSVEKRVAVEIEQARERAMATLDEEIRKSIHARLIALATDLAIKAGLVGAAYLLFVNGHLTRIGLEIVIATLLFAFLTRDAFRTLPFVMPALRLARKHKWRPRVMLTELVAGVVFERAYAQALLAAESGANRYWIALSNYSANSISDEVASAVADIARKTSYDRIRPRVIYAAFAVAAMMSAYGILVFLILHA